MKYSIMDNTMILLLFTKLSTVFGFTYMLELLVENYGTLNRAKEHVPSPQSCLISAKLLHACMSR